MSMIDLIVLMQKVKMKLKFMIYKCILIKIYIVLNNINKIILNKIKNFLIKKLFFLLFSNIKYI